MPGVFISYRREDSAGYTGRLFDILCAEFGRDNTYMDLDTIEGGDDFASVINQKISVSDVLVAVIGERWLTVTEQDGTRRLDNPRDFVRIEIAEALKRGLRVIPVLVAGASMPAAQALPDDLRALCNRQAVEIRDAHFHQDAQQLTDVLHSTLHGIGVLPAKWNIRRYAPALLLGVAVIIAAGILVSHQRRSHAPPISNQAQRGAASREAQQAPAGNRRRGGADPAQGSSQSPRGIAGKWHATVKYDWGDTYNETFDFELDGQQLSGTAGLLGEGRAIRDGKVTSKRVSFQTRTLTALGSDQYEDTHTYVGTIEGDAIRFTMVTDSRASEHKPIHFIATKVADQ